MLTKLQRYIKKNEKRVFLAVAVLVAACFGITPAMTRSCTPQPGNTVIAKIFNKDVKEFDFNNFKSRWKDNPYLIMKPSDMKEGFQEEKYYVDEAMKRYSILLDAKNKGITVTDEEAKEYIKNTFGYGGQNEQFYNFIRNRFFHMPSKQQDDDFIQTIKELITFNRYKDAVLSEHAPTAAEIYDEYIEQNKKVTALYVTLAVKDFVENIDVKDDEIIKYANEHKDEFNTLPTAQIETLFASYEALKPLTAKPSETEIKEYYEKHKEDYLIKKDKKEPKKPVNNPHEQIPKKKDAPNPNPKDKDNINEKKDDETKKDELQYKPIEDVHNEILDKLLEDKVKNDAFDKMNAIYLELSEKYENFVENQLTSPEENNNNVFTVDLSNYKTEAGLKYELFPTLEIPQLKIFEEEFGKLDQGQYPDYISASPENSLDSVIITDKGILLFTVLKKNDATKFVYNEYVKDSIKQKLQYEKAVELCEKTANQLVPAIEHETNNLMTKRNIDKPTTKQLISLREQAMRKIGHNRNLNVAHTPPFAKENSPGLPGASNWKNFSEKAIKNYGKIQFVTSDMPKDGTRDKINFFYVTLVLTETYPDGLDYEKKANSIRKSLLADKRTKGDENSFWNRYMNTIYKEKVAFTKYYKEKLKEWEEAIKEEQQNEVTEDE